MLLLFCIFFNRNILILRKDQKYSNTNEKITIYKYYRKSNNVLINIMKQRTKSFDLKKHAINYMEKAGSFKYTKEYLKDVERIKH